MLRIEEFTSFIGSCENFFFFFFPSSPALHKVIYLLAQSTLIYTQ